MGREAHVKVGACSPIQVFIQGFGVVLHSGSACASKTSAGWASCSRLAPPIWRCRGALKSGQVVLEVHQFDANANANANHGQSGHEANQNKDSE
ncbi:hypothetical protein [Ruegeria sp. SCP11]|uniref:hypothetical protein n=1 Tax=Ruegeria sp. SCP11 TaxID=3141378 RepID=UPI0033356BD5